MKVSALVVTCLFVAACGGGKKPTRPYAPPESPDDGEIVEPRDDEEEEEEPEPPPPPPQQWYAKAQLAPVKGSKMKATVVSFSQTEGAFASVLSDTAFEGLKPGTYHLVIHESGECGKNATKAGAAWEAAAIPLDITVAKGTPGSIDQSGLDLMLAGESTIVGHALVLHADKKGKAAKAVACGVIVAQESEDEPAEEGSEDE